MENDVNYFEQVHYKTPALSDSTTTGCWTNPEAYTISVSDYKWNKTLQKAWLKTN